MDINDTSQEAKGIMYGLYQQMSPARKIELVFDAYRTGQMLAMAGIRMRYPSVGEEQVWQLWAKQHLGEELYNKAYGKTNE
jgi:hypothetical protein